MMVSGAMLTSVAGLSAFLTPWFAGLLASLFVIGAGDAIWALGREAAGIDLTRQNQRGRVMSAFHGVHNGGLTLGPLLGGFLTEMVGFRAVFMAYAVSAGIGMCINHSLDPRPAACIGVSSIEGFINDSMIMLVKNRLDTPYFGENVLVGILC